MTKFESEAIGVRAGRKKSGLPTQKERKREMEHFLKTGVHTAQELAKQQTALPNLPERDPHRPHVFMDFRVGQKTLNRILIEVFDDRVPLAAQYFLNRCREGSADAFQGSTVHRLVQDQGVFGGLSRGHKSPSAHFKANLYLQHTERGTVSIATSGNEFFIALSRSLTLNATHQVVGRVHKGHETLEQLNAARVENEQPCPSILLAACGITNAQGNHESLDEAARRLAQKKLTPEEQAKHLQAEALLARDATRVALQDALNHKRKAEQVLVPARSFRKAFLDDGLGDELSSSDGEHSQDQ